MILWVSDGKWYLLRHVCHVNFNNCSRFWEDSVFHTVHRNWHNTTTSYHFYMYSCIAKHLLIYSVMVVSNLFTNESSLKILFIGLLNVYACFVFFCFYIIWNSWTCMYKFRHVGIVLEWLKLCKNIASLTLLFPSCFGFDPFFSACRTCPSLNGNYFSFTKPLGCIEKIWGLVKLICLKMWCSHFAHVIVGIFSFK